VRHVPFTGLHNVRDLGGYPGEGGRPVRWRTLYRADSLGRLAGEDLERFAGLGVRTVIDLRYPWEVERDGRVPGDVEYHNLSVEHRPYDQAALGPDVAPGPYLAERYAEVADDGAAELSAALRVIAASPAPIVFHCTSGKDRTGLLAALVLTLVGVPEQDVVADFALTGRATGRLRADWEVRWGEGRTLWPGYGQAPEETMSLFLAGLRERYGSVAAYARARLDVDDRLLTTLRERLLEAG
jgi:protein-tyrosine phosphatase